MGRNTTRAYGLCIGINDYPGTESDLHGCVNDAHDWAEELGRRGFEVELMLDKQATKKAITSRMTEVLARASSGDLVVFTFSGHGTWVEDENGDEADMRDEALCPHDVLTQGPLIDDELFEIHAGRERGVRLTMIADSCHSGTVARYFVNASEPRRVRFLAPGVLEKDPERLRQLQRLEKAPRKEGSRGGALLLAGCQDSEYSWDAVFDGRPNGAFTRVAIDSLRALPPDATYADWFRAIRQKLPSASWPQTPKMIATSSQRRWPVFRPAGPA